MPENDQNNKELNTFGFVTSKLRTGLVTGIMGILIIAIIYQQRQNNELRELIQTINDKRIDDKDELYREVIRYIRPTTERLDSAATNMNNVATKVDSATTDLINKKGNKR